MALKRTKPEHGTKRNIGDNYYPEMQTYNKWFGWINDYENDLYPWHNGISLGDSFADFRWVGKRWVHANVIPLGDHENNNIKNWRRGKRYKSWKKSVR